MRTVWLLVLIASGAGAQTATTTVPPSCTPGSAAELQQATAGDPAWRLMIGQATRHFNTSTPVTVVRCDNGVFFASFAARELTHQPAALVFLPMNPLEDRVRMYYQKTPRILIAVTMTATYRIATNADGDMRGDLLHFYGKHIRVKNSQSTS
jgi:hypothetical protein